MDAQAGFAANNTCSESDVILDNTPQLTKDQMGTAIRALSCMDAREVYACPAEVGDDPDRYVVIAIIASRERARTRYAELEGFIGNLVDGVLLYTEEEFEAVQQTCFIGQLLRRATCVLRFDDRGEILESNPYVFEEEAV